MRRGLTAALAVAAACALPALPASASVARAEGDCTATNTQPYREPPGPDRATSRIGMPTPLRTFEAERIWELSQGAGIRVAVVDSGVAGRRAGPGQRGSAYLPVGDAVLPGDNVLSSAAQLPSGATAWDPRRETGGRLYQGVGDYFGHGTMVASIIAARPTDASDMVGLAPRAQIIPIQVYTQFPSDDINGRLDSAKMAAGVERAIELKADVINLSLSDSHEHPGLRAAVLRAVAEGIVVVVSAGDKQAGEGYGDAVRYPAAYAADLPGLIAVGATSTGGGVDPASSVRNPSVEVTAPGQAIPVAAVVTDSCVTSPAFASTSYAVPYVAATAALIQSHAVATTGRKLSPAEVEWRITSSALRPDPGRRTDASGWGALNPLGALTAVRDPALLGPALPPHAAASPPVPGRWTVPEPAPIPDDRAPTRRAAVVMMGSGMLVVLALALVRRLREGSGGRLP